MYFTGYSIPCTGRVFCCWGRETLILTPVLTGSDILVVPWDADRADTELTVFTSVGTRDWSTTVCCNCCPLNNYTWNTHRIHIKNRAKKSWVSIPGCGLGISAQLTNKNTTIMQIMVDMESTENSIDSYYQLRPIQINLQAIRRWFAIALFLWLVGIELFQRNQERQYRGVFESLAAISWLSYIWLLMLYESRERNSLGGLGKLWSKTDQSIRLLSLYLCEHIRWRSTSCSFK